MKKKWQQQSCSKVLQMLFGTSSTDAVWYKFYRCCLVQVLQMLFGTSSTDAVWYKFYRCCLVRGKKGWTGLVPLMRCTRVLARQRWFCPCVLTTWQRYARGLHLTVTCQLFLLFWYAAQQPLSVKVASYAAQQLLSIKDASYTAP